MLQLLHSPLILHELLLLLEHLRKAAGRLEVQGDFSGLFRRFFRFGLGLIFLCGAVVLCRQVELVEAIVGGFLITQSPRRFCEMMAFLSSQRNIRDVL
jgi:hypothetical protein